MVMAELKMKSDDVIANFKGCRWWILEMWAVGCGRWIVDGGWRMADGRIPVAGLSFDSPRPYLACQRLYWMRTPIDARDSY